MQFVTIVIQTDILEPNYESFSKTHNGIKTLATLNDDFNFKIRRDSFNFR